MPHPLEEDLARLFGRIAVESGYVRQTDVDAALEEQSRLNARGLRVQLGQLLARKNALTVPQILEILRLQDKHVISCPCGQRFLVERPRSDARYKCGACGRELEPPAPTGLSPGTHVGRYAIAGELGRGRTGIVYKALDPTLQQTIALKVLSGHDEERFRREAAAIAQLRHPNIVTVYDAGESDGHQFIAMELLEGVPFDRAGLSARHAVEVLLQVTRAIEHAHAQRLVHRDLHPRNIMITRLRGTLWPFVLDFAVPPPGAPVDPTADISALVAMLKHFAAEERSLAALTAVQPRSAGELAGQLRLWLTSTRVRRRPRGPHT